MRKSVILFISVVLFSCNNNNSLPKVSKKELKNSANYIEYVNPMVGTKNMGHTFPGSTTPFGMVQLSPTTNIQPFFIDGKYNKDTYKYCSGYQYEDSLIYGFSHTHFSGTGHSDLGDFLLMPTVGELQLIDIQSEFSHTNENAEAGYYSVNLDKYDIKAELTSSDRVGFHQYSFQETDSAHIILDLEYNIYNFEGKNIWTSVRVENDSTITGFRQTTGWARNKTIYFAMKFSKPFRSYGHEKRDDIPYNGFYRRFNEKKNFPEMAGKNIKAYFNFMIEEDEKIQIKFALSSVSTAGALNNMDAEIPHWDFKKTKKETQDKWNNELSKIEVECIEKEDKETFYTALYHTMLGPVLYEDVDGKYKGLDKNIHISTGFTNYTIFSLWDTYRALHPLFNIIHTERNNDMIKSMLAHQDQSVHRMLPIWSHYANENWCMIGYHATSVIADAISKDVGDFNKLKALDACISTSNVSYFDGIESYKEKGYVPEDVSSSSVSKTLEFAYNDWCIAQISEKLDNSRVTKEYLKRSENFRNLYDKNIGFMRAKLKNGDWKTPFDPMDTHGQGFIEGNAWNYGLYVPHQIDTMIQIMGGKDRFSSKLDSLFNMEIDEKFIENTEDISRDGIIGNYVHGNEPGHHIPYLYNWTNDSWKTQERVRMIMNTMYGNKENGLCGNDDAGQMSAWFVFSSLGFYPVCPGSNEYAIGSPLVKNATIRLENGKKFLINTINQNKENVFVKKIELNGEVLNRDILYHHEISNGGELTFYMSNTKNPLN
ncbi:MAG TPA: glycoside hydrolase family 92 protein [Flavobacteriales bacterium]|nr:glycoside hydrolase family 92 protein [Flavobacteriales bacterium]HIK62849.1 glycoside hydrolase family 92 protein [Flavobacteriales bacterium]